MAFTNPQQAAQMWQMAEAIGQQHGTLPAKKKQKSFRPEGPPGLPTPGPGRPPAVPSIGGTY
jgi:hypothetical protein